MVPMTTKYILKVSVPCLGYNVLLLLLCQRNLDNTLFKTTRAFLYASMILAANLGNEFKTFEEKSWQHIHLSQLQLISRYSTALL